MITIHGASDDLIELEGAVDEEFGASEEGNLLAFSDGTVLRIIYSDAGVWRITPVFSGTAELHIEQCPEGDEKRYTDVATLTGGDVRWCILGTQIERAR